MCKHSLKDKIINKKKGISWRNSANFVVILKTCHSCCVVEHIFSVLQGKFQDRKAKPCCFCVRFLVCYSIFFSSLCPSKMKFPAANPSFLTPFFPFLVPFAFCTQNILYMYNFLTAILDMFQIFSVPACIHYFSSSSSPN